MYLVGSGELFAPPLLPPGGVVVEGAVDAAAAAARLQPVPQPPELGVAVAVLGGEAAAQVVAQARRQTRVPGQPSGEYTMSNMSFIQDWTKITFPGCVNMR